MELKDGNIKVLVHSNHFRDNAPSATRLVHDMLKALDYLAFKGLVHRDVKPENILYSCLPVGGHTFQLADFGLCNLISDAQTFAGSIKYMAPELFSDQASQTAKVDVWSLFFTLAEVMNVDGFRRKRLNTTASRIKAVEEAARHPDFYPLRDMAIVDPSLRASAGEMLDKLFSGDGRSTPRNEIQDSRAGIASKLPIERHSVTKPSKRQSRMKCPGCRFEGEKDVVRSHAISSGHLETRGKAIDIIDDILNGRPS